MTICLPHLRCLPICSLLVPLLFVTVSVFSAAAAEVETLERSDSPLPGTFAEPPLLAERVAAGDLPPIGERLPELPLVADFDGKTLGQPGGKLLMLVGRNKDVRLFTVYGYARLVGFDETFELVPDLLQKVEVEEGRIFTLHLRPGHRWSDGHPFTAADFRYWWEDMANNDKRFPAGPPITLLVNGEAPVFEVLDETTVRYSWSAPNPFFLPALAGARPLFIYAPAHYLKQFHPAHSDPAALQAKAEDLGLRNWAQLHNRMDSLYGFDNPDLPVLQPWRLITKPPSQRFVAERNPYFHRIDPEGLQLPYLDHFVLDVVGGSLLPIKTGAGDSDLQSRGLNFSDYTFLKEGEERGGYNVRLWETVRPSELALYPNLNAKDAVWRDLFRDVRVRRALSLAIDRELINQVIYFGLGLTGNQAVLPASPLHDETHRQAWAQFDSTAANALLDEVGLGKRNSRGVRLLPDGRPMEIVVETAGENLQETDILELAKEAWAGLGIKLFIKPLQREVLRNRIFAGDTLMTMSFGLENGIPTADLPPNEFVPVQQHSYQWPKWGQYFETKGQSGEAPDLPVALELMELYQDWQTAPDRAGRLAAWQRILEINAEQVFSFGLVAQIPQPVVAREGLHNLPETAIYNWNPGAQFGVYRTETLWIEEPARR
ncbi:ABC transporter substrate-binding protein [Algihabitans albus]|uniref:ABC transporter substrate-binding protein n=1 Tax=Algihabitans albus TaxID=2164067 RepID=UPI000E5D413C|nr:ABC transporter substrate-binding protein [Algihabitans albus]